jgi:hypothetical protein
MDGDQTRARGERADEERVEQTTRLDGNVAAGLLSELFVPDITTARATCAHCGAVRAVGALLVYAHGMGMVMRCPACDSIVMRIARTPTRLWLDPSGAKVVTMVTPTAAVA